MQPHIFPELYVHDVASTTELFENIFGAKVTYLQADFAELRIDESRMLLNKLDPQEFEKKNPIHKFGAFDHLGAGLELGIYVDDLDTVYSKALAAGLPYVSDIKLQEWGLRDFRLLLPDGYYVRVTSK